GFGERPEGALHSQSPEICDFPLDCRRGLAESSFDQGGDSGIQVVPAGGSSVATCTSCQRRPWPNRGCALVVKRSNLTAVLCLRPAVFSGVPDISPAPAALQPLVPGVDRPGSAGSNCRHLMVAGAQMSPGSGPRSSVHLSPAWPFRAGNTR